MSDAMIDEEVQRGESRQRDEAGQTKRNGA
jgi:hypothetical protein